MQIQLRSVLSLHTQSWIRLHHQLAKDLARTQVGCSSLTLVDIIANTVTLLAPGARVIPDTVATSIGIEDNETKVGSQAKET